MHKAKIFPLWLTRMVASIKIRMKMQTINAVTIPITLSQPIMITSKVIVQTKTTTAITILILLAIIIIRHLALQLLEIILLMALITKKM